MNKHNEMEENGRITSAAINVYFSIRDILIRQQGFQMKHLT